MAENIDHEIAAVFFDNNALFKKTSSDPALVQILGTSLAVPPGYIYKGTMNCTSSSSTVVNCNSVICWANSGDTITVPAAMQKNIAQTWVIGTGGGFAPSLNAANVLANVSITGIHAHAIIVNGVHDIYFDTSVIANNAPAGTTAYRRIGSLYIPGTGKIYQFIQTGDRFDYFLLLNAIAGFQASNLLTPAGTPPGIRCIGLFSGYIQSTNGGNAVFVQFDDPLVRGSGKILIQTGTFGTTSGTIQTFQIELPTDYLGNIYMFNGGSGAGAAFNLGIWGYRDRRGQDGDL
jgi:hypothetical protein